MHTVTSKGHAVKSASLQRGSAANSDGALFMISYVHVYTFLEVLKTTEWTKCSTHTHTLTCEWHCAEGAVIDAFNIVLCSGTVFGSVRVTLPAPRLCGDA